MLPLGIVKVLLLFIIGDITYGNRFGRGASADHRHRPQLLLVRAKYKTVNRCVRCAIVPTIFSLPFGMIPERLATAYDDDVPATAVVPPRRGLKIK